jgi:hypothetical protein
MATPLRARARHCALALLSLALAACAAGDSDGAPFDAEGTAADLEAIVQAYRTPVLQSFAASRGAVDRALGVATVGPATALAGARSGRDFGARARAFAREAQAVAMRGDTVGTVARPRLPAGARGATFVWDARRQGYTPTRLAGAPEDGARFLLYAVDGAGRPLSPLRQVGRLDVLELKSEDDGGLRLEVRSETTTWLAYDVRVAHSTDRASVTMRGTVGDGTGRMSFDVAAELPAEGAGRIDYRLAVPSRDVALQWTVTLDAPGSTGDRLGLDLALSSADGSVLLEGSVSGGRGTLHAFANNVPVSTVALGGDQMQFARPDGTALAPVEARALRGVVMAVEEGSRFSEMLVALM